MIFLRLASLSDIHEKRLHYIFLYAFGLPEDAFGVYVHVEMARLNRSDCASFFAGFALGGLAVGKSGVRAAFGEGPFAAAIGVDKEELNVGILPAVADCGDLQWQRKARCSG